MAGLNSATIVDHMTQNANSRGPGRPEQFNRDDVISRAVGAFWQSGFEGASLAKITEATGIERSTLYNSFGGKTGLYETAAAAYVDAVEAELFEPLQTGTSNNLSDVIEFLDRLEASTRSTDFPPGCFIVNDLRSPARDTNSTERYLAGLVGGLRGCLARSGQKGAELDRRTRVLSVGVIGVNALAQHDQGGAIDMLDALRQTVQQWRATT